jgi:hypothetical protein
MWRTILFVAACGTKQPAPHPTPPPITPDAAVALAPDAPTATGALDKNIPLLAQKSVDLHVAVAAALKVGDCAAVTTQLVALRTQYAEVTAATEKLLHEGRAKELSTALAKFNDKLEAAAKEIVGSPTMSKCSPDRAFQKAFDDVLGAPP